MINQTQTIVESTIKNYKDEKSIMNPRLMDLREKFQDEIEKRFVNDPNKKLIQLESIQEVKSIDGDTIIEINNQTTSEIRAGFINNIINHSNSGDNLTLLINNSSKTTKDYINSLLIKYSNGDILSINEFKIVGNILLYSISGLNTENINIEYIMSDLQKVFFDYNNQQSIPQIRGDIIVDYKLVLDKQNLLTDTQLNQTVDNFYQEVDQREESYKEQRLIQSRKRILMVGGGILATMALSSLGVPSLVGGFVGRNALNSVLDSNFISDYTNRTSPTDSVRLRDIYDEGLKFFYKTIKHFNK